MWKRNHALILFLILTFVCVSSFVYSEEVLLLPRPPEAAKVRLDLIEDAKKEIFISTYIFIEDRIGKQLMASLSEAAKKNNVKVTILIDGLTHSTLTQKISPELIAYLSQVGIKIYVYNPVNLLRPIRSNARLHDKLFIVDEQHLILGDRNIANEYFGLSTQSRLSKDIYVNGKSAKGASDYFKELLKSSEIELLEAPEVSKDQMDRIGKELSFYLKPQGLIKKLESYSDWRSKVKKVEEAKFSHDPINLKGKEPGVEVELLSAIKRAKDKIVIENAYIVLTDEFRDALKSAANRGVKIEIITNSSDSTNKQIVAAAWKESRDFLASIGASVWEHPGTRSTQSRQRLRRFDNRISKMETMLHSKTMIIDEREIFCMSFNMDPRSQKLNTEVVEHVIDETVAKELNSILELEKNELKYIQTVRLGKMENTTRECSRLFKFLAHVFKGQL